MQPKNNKILFLFFSFFIGIVFCNAQDIPIKRTLNSKKDSLFTQNNSVKIKQNLVVKDSIKIDSVKLPKELLEAIIKDNSKDKYNDFINRKAKLVDEAELFYQDVELKAGVITIDYAKNLAYAKGIVDSLGIYKQRPFFKQGSQESLQDSLIYNFKTKKAIVYNVDSEQNGMLVNAQIMKRENDSTIYMNKAEITTSKKKKRDYFIRVNNIKIIPDKKAIGGASQLFIADVPTPIAFPFFYVPLTKGRASGVLLPTFGDNNRGYFLENGGFYFVLNDYIDLAVTGSIFTNGSWSMRFDSSYKKRYKLSGNFSLQFDNIINGQRGLSNFTKTNNFNLRWSHSQDAKASPNSRFSASVNFGSSQFFRQSINELNTSSSLRNNLSSSISYYKNFVNTPFSFNAALTHSQNTNSEVINMSLPNLSVNMDRIYPFSKDGSKKNAIENIGLTYSMSLQNNIVTNDDDFLKSEMFKDAKSGVQHNISMSTNIKALKYITLTPTANYEDVWYLKTIDKNYDAVNNEVVTDTINGFESFRTYSGGISASTKIYGLFNFKKGRIKAIRHTITPSVGYNYTPDFSFYYEDVQNNVNETTEQFSKFDGGVFGAPSKNLSQNLSFAIRNIFEAKIKDKDSTKTTYKNITLLNNLDFSTSYNIAADSLNWSPMRMTASTKLFESLNLNFNATLDPYAINANGRKFNTFNINNGGSLFRLTSAGLIASYSLSNDTFSKEKKKDKNDNQEQEEEINQFGNDAVFNGNNTSNNDDEEEVKKVKLFSYKIPWKLSLYYDVGYSNSNREKEISRNTLGFSGSLELTPKWDITYNSGYDIKGKGLSHTRLGFARDLDSWRMNFSWTPLGNNATYYFFIGVKASTLSDLKYDQRKVPDRRLF